MAEVARLFDTGSGAFTRLFDERGFETLAESDEEGGEHGRTLSDGD